MKNYVIVNSCIVLIWHVNPNLSTLDRVSVGTCVIGRLSTQCGHVSLEGVSP